MALSAPVFDHARPRAPRPAPHPRAASACAVALCVMMSWVTAGCDDAQEVTPLTLGGGLVAGAEAGGLTPGGAGAVTPEDPANPLGPRPTAQTCWLPNPPAPTPLMAEPISGVRVPSVVGAQVIGGLEGASGGRAMVAVERGGGVWAWRDGEPARAIGSLTARGAALSVTALATSPSIEGGRALFVLAQVTRCANGAPCARLSRWRLADPTAPLALEPASEEVLLEVPQGGQAGGGQAGGAQGGGALAAGGLAFGSDGTLYVGVGAGAGALAPAQGALSGAILRLDVRATDPECGLAYAIPSTNPLAANRCGAGEGGRPELWAWGLRWPTRLSFDASSQGLFVSVEGGGVSAVERVVGGGHHGWPVMEGEACVEAGCDRAGFVLPMVTLTRGAGLPPDEPALTGGVVYRGATHPTLVGYYLYVDRAARRLVATPPNAPLRAQVILEGVDVVAISEDGDSEVVLWGADGAASRLVSSSDAPPAALFPQLLSLTGCFSDISSATLADSVVPYEVNRPFWSDLADKERAFAIPVGSEITYKPAGEPLGFPLDSVIIKTFYLTDRAGVKRRYETRLLHNSRQGWVGYTYRWRDDLSDADLLLNGYEQTLEGPLGPQVWSFLDPSACTECHTGPSGRTLGLSIEQLNLTAEYEGGALNQLDALERAGYLRLPAPPGTLDRLAPTGDESISVEREAREFLHVNCAYCHLPEGLPHLRLDLRLHTPLSEMGICDEPPTLGDVVVPNARLLAPGSPNRSVLLLRALARGFGQMPPLGSHMENFEGTAALALWISQLTGCSQ